MPDFLSCDSLPQYYDLDQARIYGQRAITDFQEADKKMKLAFTTASFNLLDIEKTNTNIENQTYEKILSQYTMDGFHFSFSISQKYLCRVSFIKLIA